MPTKVKYVVAPIIAPALETSAEQYEVYLLNYGKYRGAVSAMKQAVKEVLVEKREKESRVKEKRAAPAPLNEEQKQARRQRRSAKKSERRKLRKQQAAIEDAGRQVKLLSLKTKAASLQKEVRKVEKVNKPVVEVTPVKGKTLEKKGTQANANRKARRFHLNLSSCSAEKRSPSVVGVRAPSVVSVDGSSGLAALRTSVPVREYTRPLPNRVGTSSVLSAEEAERKAAERLVEGAQYAADRIVAARAAERAKPKSKSHQMADLLGLSRGGDSKGKSLFED